MHKTLGLDISTSITGATIIQDGKILKTSFLNRPLLGNPIFIKFFIIENLS